VDVTVVMVIMVVRALCVVSRVLCC